MSHGKIVNCLYHFYGARKMERAKNLSPNLGAGSRFHSVEDVGEGGFRIPKAADFARPLIRQSGMNNYIKADSIKNVNS